MSTALQQPPRSRRLVAMSRAAPPVLTLHEVGHGYRAGGSFVLSFFLHIVAVLLVVFLGRHALLRPPLIIERPNLEARATDILYLPSLGGGAEGGGDVGGGSGTAQISSPAVQARSRRGFAYPGRQPIVSNPPGAKLGIQTILQPSLENLPRLRSYMELPNIVQPPVPAPEPVPTQRPLVVKGGKLALAKQPDLPTAAVPKLTVPATPNNSLAGLVEPRPQIPRASPEAVDPPRTALTAARDKGLVVLNAVPPPPDTKADIPRAEARSLFAVSPAEATVIAPPSGGSAKAGSVPSAPGTGGANGARTGDAISETGSAGTSLGEVAGGEGVGHSIGNGHGDAKGAGLSSTPGAGIGRGDSSGPGVGAASATGHGSGTGAGSAPGQGGFAGITIQGGRYGNSVNLVAKAPAPPRQTSYSMTIESTAGSGGLPDLGVFRNEKVYTVYLDMRSSDDDHTPSWTLQYAVLRGESNRTNSAGLMPRVPSPPYAVLKQVPQFSPAIARNCARGLIVASAILGTDGKLQQVLIKQTPENQVTVPLVQALKEWMFEPAKIDGHPVALKILLGIRLPMVH